MERENKYISFIGVFLIAFGSIVFSATTYAETFSAVGEYTLSDYDTIEIAEQRALDYARRNLAEKAGIYFENLSLAQNFVITKDEIRTVTNDQMRILRQNTKKTILPNGIIHIRAEMSAAINGTGIEELAKMQVDEKNKRVQHYMTLKKGKEDLDRRLLDLKDKISHISVDDLADNSEIISEQERQEREFKAMEKLREGNQLTGQQRIHSYKEALALNPKCAYAYNNLGCEYNLNDNHCMLEYKKAIVLDSNCAEAYYNRGNFYAIKGDFNASIREYNEAVRSNANYAMAYANRGLVFNFQGEHKKAIADYMNAIKLNPSDAVSYYNIGITYYKLGDYDKAIENYNQALRILPTYTKAQQSRYNAYLAKKSKSN